MLEKDENLPHHQKLSITDQLSPKARRTYFHNKEDRAEMRTLEA